MSGSVTISVRQGPLHGVVEKNFSGGTYFAFKGIPYAKPPIGDLRFRDPQPPEPWSGTWDATAHGSNCAQLDMMTRSIHGSDDCLYLNVYVATISDPVKPRPVMVWIHGGAFVHGSGDTSIYGPDYLVKKDIVLVTINYRLGVLGFLNLEDEVAPGNQGLKDQVQALRWVQENISSFGGDPANVTIFGESAGAASVHYLALSPLAKGLFHKAISQSGVALCAWASIPRNPKSYACKLSEHLGKKSIDAREIIEFLRTVDCHKLIEAQEQLQTTEEKLQLIRPFGPGIDKASREPFLPLPLSEIANEGIEVPYILGYNSHEGILILAGMKEKTFERINADFDIAVHPKILSPAKRSGRMTSDEIRRLYFGTEAISRKNAHKYMEMSGDMYFVNDIQHVAKIQAERSKSPTYLYKFSHDSGQSLVKGALNLDVPGTCHTDELAYLFYPHVLNLMGKKPPEAGSIERKIIEQFTQMWTNFARTGNPTPSATSLVRCIWRPVSNATALHYLEISDQLRTGINPDLEKRLAWDRIKNKL